MKPAATNRTDEALKLNPQCYGRLLAQRLPTVIRTERENEEMLAAIWELMKKGEANLSAGRAGFARTDVGPGRAI